MSQSEQPQFIRVSKLARRWDASDESIRRRIRAREIPAQRLPPPHGPLVVPLAYVEAAERETAARETDRGAA